VPESSLYSVKQDDAEVQMLREIAADPSTPTHLRLGALNSLQKLKPAEPEPARDPLGVMQQIVERYCPQTADERELPPDPMRALDYESFTGEKPDPLAMSWLPYCPTEPQKAARAVAAASRRLGVGQGPYGQPEDDDLSRRRRKRRTG
jgi:hypothetical protein